MLLVERRLEDIEGILGRLTAQLSGDGSDLSPGVVGILLSHTDQLRTQEGRLGRMERTVDRFRWTLAGASAVGGLLGGGLVFLISQLVEAAPL
jgi:hypothetical protein